MYIKLFESFLGYSELTSLEFSHKIYSSVTSAPFLEKMEVFTSGEVKLIGEYLPKFDIQLSKIFDRERSVDCMLICEHRDNDSTLICNVTIIKFRDEWYYVEVFDNYPNYVRKNTRSHQSKSRFYECDQFDGLKELLSEFNI